METEKWEQILAEAAKSFARFGFKKTSMEEVARAAGVAKGTVYLGCESKRDLFYQVLLRELRRWDAELARTIDPRVPADATGGWRGLTGGRMPRLRACRRGPGRAGPRSPAG